MKQLEFDSVYHMQDYFLSEKGIAESSIHIVKTVEESAEKNSKNTKLYSISLLEEGYDVSVAISRKDWIPALEQCLKNLEDLEMQDEVIDTYLILKKVKEKNN